MRLLLLPATILALFTASAQAAPEHYEFDKSHTRILFFISHLGFSESVGEFTDYDGKILFDEKEPAKSSLDITIKPASVRTPSTALDEHLQKKDFFNTESFPELRFVSTGIKMTGEHDGDVTGNVTLLGITKPVTLKVHFNNAGYHPMTQDYVAGFKAVATLKRSDFGMSYGIPNVGDEVRVEVYTEILNTDRKKNEAIKRD